MRRYPHNGDVLLCCIDEVYHPVELTGAITDPPGSDQSDPDFHRSDPTHGGEIVWEAKISDWIVAPSGSLAVALGPKNTHILSRDTGHNLCMHWPPWDGY